MKTVAEQLIDMQIGQSATYLLSIRGAHPAYMATLSDRLIEEGRHLGDNVVNINITSEPSSDYGGHRTVLVTDPRRETNGQIGNGYVHPTLEEEELHEMVFGNSETIAVLRQLIEEGNRVVINPYKNSLHIDGLDIAIPDIEVLGPTGNLVESWDNKFYQFSRFQESGLNVPPGEIVEGLNELERKLAEIDSEEGAFVTIKNSHSGLGSARVRSVEDIRRRFTNPHETYLITSWIKDIVCAPCCFGIVGDEGVLVLDPADQIFENQVQYRGNIFPSILSRELQNKVREENRKVGELLKKDDYRGIYCCDFISDGKEIYLIEVNPRKFGHLSTLTLMYDAEGKVNIPQLILNSHFSEPIFNGEDKQQVGVNPNYNWSMYRIVQNTETPLILTKDISELVGETDEAKTFDSYGVVAVNPLAAGTIIHPGATLARLCVYQPSREDVLKAIRSTEALIRQNTKPY